MLPVESEDSSLAYGMKQSQTHFRRSKLLTIPHREMRYQLPSAFPKPYISIMFQSEDSRITLILGHASS
jgi:hypothetical protein